MTEYCHVLLIIALPISDFSSRDTASDSSTTAVIAVVVVAVVLLIAAWVLYK